MRAASLLFIRTAGAAGLAGGRETSGAQTHGGEGGPAAGTPRLVASPRPFPQEGTELSPKQTESKP